MKPKAVHKLTPWLQDLPLVVCDRKTLGTRTGRQSWRNVTCKRCIAKKGKSERPLRVRR